MTNFDPPHLGDDLPPLEEDPLPLEKDPLRDIKRIYTSIAQHENPNFVFDSQTFEHDLEEACKSMSLNVQGLSTYLTNSFANKCKQEVLGRRYGRSMALELFVAGWIYALMGKKDSSDDQVHEKKE